jgi:hypothetical protein
MARAADGAARLAVHARRKPFSAAVTVADSSRDDAQALFTATSNAQTRHGEQLTASCCCPGEDQVHYQRLDYSQYLDAAGSNCCCRLRATAERHAHRLDDGRDITREHDSERYAIGLASR